MSHISTEHWWFRHTISAAFNEYLMIFLYGYLSKSTSKNREQKKREERANDSRLFDSLCYTFTTTTSATFQLNLILSLCASSAISKNHFPWNFIFHNGFPDIYIVFVSIYIYLRIDAHAHLFLKPVSLYLSHSLHHTQSAGDFVCWLWKWFGWFYFLFWRVKRYFSVESLTIVIKNARNTHSHVGNCVCFSIISFFLIYAKWIQLS